MRKRPIIPAGLLYLVAVCGLVQGCGGLGEHRGARPAGGTSSPPVGAPRGGGQVVARFLVSVKPSEGTMTIGPVATGEARVALRPYGPEDALKLTSTGVAFDAVTKRLSGDVKIASTHPLPMFDTKVVIESISSTSVLPVLDAAKGDGTLPANNRPFYNYGDMKAGATTAARKWIFENPSGVSFTFTVFVYANVWLPSPGDGSSITSITFPSRNNGWAAGDQGKILATVDGGATWNAQNTRANLDFKDVYFVSIDTGFACGSNETIVRTTNRGRAWKTLRTSIDPAIGRLNSIFFLDGQRGWAAGENGTVLYTTNGGDSWTKVSITDRALQVIRFANAQVGWAVGDAGRIFKSIDGGVTWTAQALPVGIIAPTLTQLQGLAVLDTNNAVIVGSIGLILRTGNGGTNWTKVALPSGTPTSNLFGISFANSTTGWIAGASGMVLKTTTGGTSWTRQSAGTSVNLLAIAAPKNQTTFLCVGGAAGSILFNIGGGAGTWQRPGGGGGTSSQLNATDWLDLVRGWAVGMNGTILRTINGGQTWINSTNTVNENLNDVYFVTQDIGYAVGSIGTILKTTNGGASWTQQASGYTGGPDLPTATFRGVRFPNLNVGWVCGSNGVLLKTTNGGSSWVKASFPSEGIVLEKMVWTDPQNGWIVYSGGGQAGGGIFRTSNGGNSWSFQAGAPGADLYGIRMFGPENNFLGFAVGQNGVVMRTLNGTNWSPITTVPTAARTGAFHGVDFADAKNGWIVGEGGVVLRTSNGGTNWTIVDAGTDRNLYDAFFWEVDYGWVVGATGTLRKLN